MTAKSLTIATACMFVIAVGTYYGMQSWTFGHVRGSYVRAFVLASAVAVSMVRGDRFSLWLTAGLAACGAGSAFELAFYSYPDGTTAYGLIIPGAALSLVCFTILASEALRGTHQPIEPWDSAPCEGLDSLTTSTQEEGTCDRVPGDRFRRMSVVLLVFVGVVLLAASDQVADMINDN
ncbi:MAG: hypothetical protein U0936_04900 [Planctomycetaceae bacterium]